MADEQDRWLDRETAELLLRGESPQAVDPAARERAERLAGALAALSAPPVPTSEELPGEAAALAAFRKVRAERADAPEGASAALGQGAATPPSDAGLVRIGPRRDDARRLRRRRPLRLGLAAALTVGMIGGAAVAAGTGVLPTPFDGTRPDPAATVSAAASPDRPPAPPSPLDGARGGSVPGGPTPGALDRGSAGDDADGGTAEDGDTDADGRASGGGRPGLVAACRDVRAGKGLDGSRRRALKEAAGGSSRVGKYCGKLLAGTDGGAQDRSGGREGGRDSAESAEGNPERGTGKDSGAKNDRNGKSGKNGKSGNGGEGGGGGQDGKGGEGGKKSGGDKGGKGDDDGDHIAPPAGQHHDPHAPSAFEHLPRQRPTYSPHTSATAGHLPLDPHFSGVTGISSPGV
ncbi:hypothetical protein ACIQ8D_01940 [Streptomyces sp. NPDC096094]|uniref:hypothetical protein n=1 Tax=Streptomyces sp. NPDC096094 TaxID=3366073 RepID=UPI0037F44A33